MLKTKHIHLYFLAELLWDMSEVLENNTMYTFEAWLRQVEEETNTIMSTEQNGQRKFIKYVIIYLNSRN